MSVANYRSTRLLVEAVNQEMENVRKAAMGNMALGPLNDLRDLVAQLVERAKRLAVEDVPELAPADYVATMKPLVADYHRQLAARDLLVPCLCMDLRASACVVVLIGDGKSTMRAAHDPDRPEAALVVETLLTLLDDGLKQVVAEVAANKEQVASAFTGVDQQAGEPLNYETTPLTVESIERALEETLRSGDGPYDRQVANPTVDDESGDVELCGGCDCVAGECDCIDCEWCVPDEDRTP